MHKNGNKIHPMGHGAVQSYVMLNCLWQGQAFPRGTAVWEEAQNSRRPEWLSSQNFLKNLMWRFKCCFQSALYQFHYSCIVIILTKRSVGGVSLQKQVGRWKGDLNGKWRRQEVGINLPALLLFLSPLEQIMPSCRGGRQTDLWRSGLDWKVLLFHPLSHQTSRGFCDQVVIFCHLLKTLLKVVECPWFKWYFKPRERTDGFWKHQQDCSTPLGWVTQWPFLGLKIAAALLESCRTLSSVLVCAKCWCKVACASNGFLLINATKVTFTETESYTFHTLYSVPVNTIYY